jgi:hypothetical protein
MILVMAEPNFSIPLSFGAIGVPAGTRWPGGIGSLPAGGTGEVARHAFVSGNHMADHHGSPGAATPPGELTHGLHRWIHDPGLAPLPVAATLNS